MSATPFSKLCLALLVAGTLDFRCSAQWAAPVIAPVRTRPPTLTQSPLKDSRLRPTPID